MEDGRGAIIVARMDAGQHRDIFGRRHQQLKAHVLLIIAAHRVLLGGHGAVGAGAGVCIVDPVVAMLVEGRDAEGELVRDDRAADAAVEGDGVIAAIAGLGATFPIHRRTDGVELDDARRGVAAEQRTLRAAQHFHLVDVEHRVRLQHDMFQHDIVLDDRHRLRRTQIEVDIAQAADVEAREDAAGGGFGIEAGHAGGEFENVAAAGGQVAQRIALHDADRDGHLLQIFRAALGGHDDLVELAGVSARFLRMGGATKGERTEGRGQQQRRPCESEFRQGYSPIILLLRPGQRRPCACRPGCHRR